MERKGYYTGRKIYVPQDNKTYLVGKIVGYNGMGKPVYETLNSNGNKVGELNVEFIKEYAKSQKRVKNWRNQVQQWMEEERERRHKK